MYSNIGKVRKIVLRNSITDNFKFNLVIHTYTPVQILYFMQYFCYVSVFS